MKKAIYYRLLSLSFAAVLVCSLIAAMIYAFNSQNQTKEWLTQLTLSIAENYKYEGDAKSLSKSAGNNRISIIAPDGRVLSDSQVEDTADMENHAEREEVKNASEKHVNISIRNSLTTGERLMYASIKAHDGNILRLAHSYSGFFDNLTAQVPAILVAIFAAFLLSLFLAGRFTKTVIKPLEKMLDALSVHEYNKLMDFKSPYYEIDKMMHSLQNLLHKITDSNEKFKSEQEKVEHILSNMSEGFVLLDSSKNILLCNNSAKSFFDYKSEAELENIYNLSRNKTIANNLDLAISNEQSTVFDLSLKDDLIANIYISPTKARENETGATMIIVDMTAEKLLEQKKRDFFSNASHELKTPITSILGFSEMLNNGMIKNEDEKTEILGRIETEAKRMSELIRDILTVSTLESNSEKTERSSINLADIVREAVTAISPFNEQTKIDISLDLDDAFYQADKRQIYKLCINLIENAIKYNKPNGEVRISLKKDAQNVVLTIKDSGIGIPLEYQSRVFERFFRVDLGRDKKVGGSGLGLSIVKHIANIYQANISLQSRKDEGTTISISLPISAN